MTYDLNYRPNGPPKKRVVYSGEDFVKKYDEALEVIKELESKIEELQKEVQYFRNKAASR